VAQGVFYPQSFNFIQVYDIIPGIIPAIPECFRGSFNAIAVFVTSAFKYHRIEGDEVSLSTDILPKRQLTTMVLVVFESPTVGTYTPKVIIFIAVVF